MQEALFGEAELPKAPPPPRKRMSIAAHIREFGYKHSHWQVFTDFLELASCAISNRYDWAQYEAREARYMEIVKRYEKDEVNRLCEMLAELVFQTADGLDDYLGRAFHDLELHNKWKGQFFTPFNICEMMAKMTLGDGHKGMIAEKGYITVCEPCVGAGAMLLAFAKAAAAEGINIEQEIHFTGQDIDLKCVHMAYLQLSLAGIPAMLIHGNSLWNEQLSIWYTPAHIMGGWSMRLRKDQPEEVKPKTVAFPETGNGTEPLFALEEIA
jgi:hypothetical protein